MTGEVACPLCLAGDGLGGAECGDRRDGRGPPRGAVRGHYGHQQGDPVSEQDGERADGEVDVVLRTHHRDHRGAKGHTGECAEGAAGQSEHTGLGDDPGPDLALACADGPQQRELPGPPAHQQREGVGDDEHADQERDRSEGQHRHPEVLCLGVRLLNGSVGQGTARLDVVLVGYALLRGGLEGAGARTGGGDQLDAVEARAEQLRGGRRVVSHHRHRVGRLVRVRRGPGAQTVVGEQRRHFGRVGASVGQQHLCGLAHRDAGGVGIGLVERDLARTGGCRARLHGEALVVAPVRAGPVQDRGRPDELVATADQPGAADDHTLGAPDPGRTGQPVPVRGREQRFLPGALHRDTYVVTGFPAREGGGDGVAHHPASDRRRHTERDGDERHHHPALVREQVAQHCLQHQAAAFSKDFIRSSTLPASGARSSPTRWPSLRKSTRSA